MKDECIKLCETILHLRQSNTFYKKKFRYVTIEDATGIPKGSLHYFIKTKKLPLYRYNLLRDYVKTTIIEYEKWIANPNPIKIS